MISTAIAPPILSCADALSLERDRFHGDDKKEWAAMQSAGRAVATSVQDDFREIGPFPKAARVLVLVGKGHNGGDALIAARFILEAHPLASAELVFVFGQRGLRPLASRALRDLVHAAGERATLSSLARGATLPADPFRGFDVCIDGVFGFQFRPPVDARVAELFAAVNASSIRFRAAVDLPSANLFKADFTYATGSVKAPVLQNESAGRIRYLDLGFFDGHAPVAPAHDDRVLTTGVLDPLLAPRSATSDKRSHGHVFLIGGSRAYPGAILMAAMAAARSGAGLVTAFVPERLAQAFAARLPEAIWVGWPETPEGGLALEGEHLLHARMDRADSLVIGPGIGREPETLALARSIVSGSPVPVVIDADALQREIIGEGEAPRVVTPHAGEYDRIAGNSDLPAFSRDSRCTVVLKGPVTRVCGGGAVHHSFFGGPVLARGGSGDLLAGMIGTQLAQIPDNPLLAASRAVVWHGCAADCLARECGQVAVLTTQLLDHLGSTLRNIQAH